MVQRYDVCRWGLVPGTLKAFRELVAARQPNPVAFQTKIFSFSRRISSFLGVTPGVRRALQAFIHIIIHPLSTHDRTSSLATSNVARQRQCRSGRCICCRVVAVAVAVAPAAFV